MKGSPPTMRMRVSIACPRFTDTAEGRSPASSPPGLVTLQELSAVQRHDLLRHRPLDPGLRRAEERRGLVRLAELEVEFQPGTVAARAALDGDGDARLGPHVLRQMSHRHLEGAREVPRIDQ